MTTRSVAATGEPHGRPALLVGLDGRSPIVSAGCRGCDHETGYQQLRDEGLIELRRGRGAVVREGAQAGRATVIELALQLVAAARHMDLDDEELLGLVRAAAQAN